ncbi:hypothetical protein L6452_18018 [Arctium lappa]|uniref:Uncharacterized protein n=1 Tax=Arctium lappa TaxID=4217 RepID=A0ACB9C4V9_ARCLA|nr:hypothetical protein L6452_18018 [Arctium lappa]
MSKPHFAPVTFFGFEKLYEVLGGGMVDDLKVLKSDAEKDVKEAKMNTRVDEEMEKKFKNLKLKDSDTFRGREG